MDTYSGLTSGTVLEGRYRVGAVIARGGMSMVYRGVDLRLDRPVAIKVMSPHYVSDPAFLSRFEREARLAASLGHSGVVAVYDQGRDGDLVFLVMELVDGGTLRDLLREHGSLSVPVTMSIMEPLLAALGAAHAAGLVHRDVKPENVLISSQGAVKIADFGLVRAVTSQTMATGDVILGTVAYLSPEQVATGAADARSDVYAAGVMAYEMLTGQPPFNGDNPMSVAYQHVHSDVPRAVEQCARHPGGTGRPDRRGHPARPGAAPPGRLGVPVGDGRDPVATGPGHGCRCPSRTAGPAPVTNQPITNHQVTGQPELVAPSGTRVLSANGPVTVAQSPPPVLVQQVPTETAPTSRRRARSLAHRRAAAADPPPLADRDPGGTADRPRRRRRRLVDRRPVGGHPGRRRVDPVPGRDGGPGRRAGPPGHR